MIKTLKGMIKEFELGQARALRQICGVLYQLRCVNSFWIRDWRSTVQDDRGSLIFVEGSQVVDIFNNMLGQLARNFDSYELNDEIFASFQYAYGHNAIDHDLEGGAIYVVEEASSEGYGGNDLEG